MTENDSPLCAVDVVFMFASLSGEFVNVDSLEPSSVNFTQVWPSMTPQSVLAHSRVVPPLSMLNDSKPPMPVSGIVTGLPPLIAVAYVDCAVS